MHSFINGIFSNIPNDRYHYGPDLGKMLSKGGLVALDKSPAHFIASQENRTENPVLIFGQGFHVFILEGDDRFFEDFVIWSSGRKYGKKWDEFREEHEGKHIITEEEMDTLICMREAVMNHETASKLILMAQDQGDIEKTVIWKDPVFGFMCKCRPDLVWPYLESLGDLKSCTDASPDGFSRAMANFKYHWQGSWYINGMNQAQEDVFYRKFIFICVEKTKPYGVAVYNMAYEDLDKGRDQIRPLLPIYDECIKTEVWGCYPDEVQDIYLPSWA